MNHRKNFLSACLLGLVALAGGTSPAFAAGAPLLGAASNFAVLSAAPLGGGAVTCTNSTITGDVGSSGAPASIVQTSCTITGSAIAPVSAQVLTGFNGAYDALAAVSCDQTLTGVAASGCEGGSMKPSKQRCNQGVGNGPEACDPGKPGRKGGNR